MGLFENKGLSENRSRTLPAVQKCLVVNGCVSLHPCLLCTAVDEQSHAPRLTVVSHKAKKKHTVHDEQVSYLQVHVMYGPTWHACSCTNPI